jgi:hypothetical protein
MRTVAAPRPDAPPVTSALEPLIFMDFSVFISRIFLAANLTRNKHEFQAKI